MLSDCMFHIRRKETVATVNVHGHQTESVAMNRILILLFVWFTILAAGSCSLVIYDTRKLLNDFKTTGFLDQDHYQVIVKGAPDAKSRGLVQSRISAFEDAKSRINGIVISSLSGYFFSYQIKRHKLKGIHDILNYDDARRELEKELAGYLRYGYIAFEIYEADYSAVIIYRLYKRRLITGIESINIKMILKQESMTPAHVK